MEAGETHLDMLAKPNPGVCVCGGGWRVREKGKQGGEKKWCLELGVVGTTSSQRHLVLTWRNCILKLLLAAGL